MTWKRKPTVQHRSGRLTISKMTQLVAIGCMFLLACLVAGLPVLLHVIASLRTYTLSSSPIFLSPDVAQRMRPETLDIMGSVAASYRVRDTDVINLPSSSSSSPVLLADLIDAAVGVTPALPTALGIDLDAARGGDNTSTSLRKPRHRQSSPAEALALHALRAGGRSFFPPSSSTLTTTLQKPQRRVLCATFAPLDRSAFDAVAAKVLISNPAAI